MAKDADTAFPRHTINTAADALGEAAMMLEAIRLGYTFSAREYNDRLGLIRLHMSDKQRSRLHQRLIVGEKSANTGAAA